MMALYELINKRAHSTFTKKVSGENFSEWVQHWFATCDVVRKEFEAEGLSNSIAALDNIVIQQKALERL